jgi:hypothetical protein
MGEFSSEMDLADDERLLLALGLGLGPRPFGPNNALNRRSGSFRGPVIDPATRGS